ncbi:hypothetical protein [Halopelagius fulvigenes]|uniref:Uncharacterized protein n=1 Tax=Halopelagius fulvigenes TaxID=1198324 RepID=A0ABD5TT93_9EURY
MPPNKHLDTVDVEELISAVELRAPKYDLLTNAPANDGSLVYITGADGDTSGLYVHDGTWVGPLGSGSGGSYTDEQARDALAAALSGGNQITVMHDDANDALTVSFDGDADTVDGLHRQDFAYNTRTFHIESNGTEEWFKICKITEDGNFQDGKIWAHVTTATPNNSLKTREFILSASVERTDTTDPRWRAFGEGQQRVHAVVTKDANNHFYLYMKAPSYCDARLETRNGAKFGSYDFQMELTASDVLGTVVYNTENNPPDAVHETGVIRAKRLYDAGQRVLTDAGFESETPVTFITEDVPNAAVTRPLMWDGEARTIYCSPNGTADGAGTQADPMTLQGVVESLPHFYSAPVTIDLYTVPNANRALPAVYNNGLNTYRPPIMAGTTTTADVEFLGNPADPSQVVMENGLNWAAYGKGDSLVNGIQFNASVQLNGFVTLMDSTVYQKGTYGTSGICLGTKKGVIKVKGSVIGEGNVGTAINVTDMANIGIAGGSVVARSGSHPLSGGPGTKFTAVSGCSMTSANGVDPGAEKGVGNMRDTELAGTIHGQGVEIIDNGGRRAIHQGSTREIYKSAVSI